MKIIHTSNRVIFPRISSDRDIHSIPVYFKFLIQANGLFGIRIRNPTEPDPFKRTQVETTSKGKVGQ